MAVTPNYSWPVPVNTDLVKDGAEAIKDLGDAIDATVFGLPSGALALINTTTFSAVAIQSINDVFSATYNNYKVIINLSNSVDSYIQFRYRVSGTDTSSANYSFVAPMMVSTSASVFGENLNATTSLAIGYSFTANMSSDLTIFKPFLTDTTTNTAFAISPTGTAVVGRLYSGFLNNTTSYTGFSIFATSGNITGTVSVYGIAK